MPIAIVFLVIALVAPASLTAQETVEGLWAGPSALVDVRADASNRLSMVIVSLLDPLDDNGNPVRDMENPDDTLRGRPILGLNLLQNVTKDGDRWEGKIYDPESGNTYSARIRVKDGMLEMRGYIGSPIFGRTEKYRPISTCDEDIRQMIALVELGAPCP